MQQKECPAGKEFVFRTPDNKEVGRAKTVRELFVNIQSAPLSSVLHHVGGKHFSPWLDMMGEHVLSIKAKAIAGHDEKVRTSLLRLYK
jgi:hypothetical protein